ncbi:MAG: ABC transporter ATP-binding protein [Elusimicrobiota bacterium]
MDNGLVIKISDVHKIYNIGEIKVNALRGVSFEVKCNEFVAIMGPSGSGKSTMMNIIGCLDSPSSGSYFLDGIDAAKLNKDQLAEVRNKKIGFVFQNFNLLSRTMALENVELPMMYNNVPKVERHKRAKEALAVVGLAKRAKNYTTQMSGGEQQRVAIARALVNNTPIILADEPTGNLDTRTSVEIMSIFQALNDKGITIIIVTHEHDIAQYAKRKVVFRDGKIVLDESIPDRLVATEVIKSLNTDVTGYR